MRGLKRLISGLLCSVLVLGLASNSGVSSSHAEENVVTSDPTNLSESLESDNQSEQSSEPSGSTENEENIVSDEKSSEMIDQISDQNNENNDISEKKSSDSTEQSSVSSKKQLAKSNLAVAQTESGESFPINDCTYVNNKDGSITLTGYHGTKTDLVIPSKISFNGQEVNVKVKFLNTNINALFPTSVHSVTFRSVNGTKVQLENNTPGGVNLNHLFAISNVVYPNLTSLDFSGLDMSNVISMYSTFNGSFIPSLKTINFGDNTLSNVTTMELAFSNLNSLETIQQHWTFGKLTTMYQMIWMSENNTSQLTSIGDTSQWNTSTVTNMQEVFLNCVKLKRLNLSTWNVSNVTTMNSMFFNCRGLESIENTGNWNISNVKDFKGMFYNCVSLDTIHMDNWQIAEDAQLGSISPDFDNPMFYLYSRGYDPLPALIIASDKKLLNYSYAEAGYKPKCEIRINANTGNVAKNPYWDRQNDKNTDLSYYFYQIAIPTSTYTELEQLSGSELQSKIREWLEDNVPTKADFALKGWAPTDPSFNQKIEQVTDFSTFMSSQAEFKAEWVSDKFDTSSDNTKLDPAGSLGLAYYPTTFTLDSAELQSSGQQEIPIPKTTSFNVGVKDRTRTQDEWYVTAQLIWDKIQIPNAYIQATNSNGTVMQNISTGSGNYDPITDLQSLQGSGITGMANYKITTMPNTIMESSGSTVNNGVYDYDLGDLKLVIPDVSQVRAGTYSGQVEWNLINGPA